MPTPTSSRITPSSHIAATPCIRIYHHGHTFRLARGDTHIAVFRGTTIEQRRYLVIRDHLPPGPVTEGPQPPIAMIPTPPGHDWINATALRTIAHHWITAQIPQPRTGWHSTRPGD